MPPQRDIVLELEDFYNPGVVHSVRPLSASWSHHLKTAPDRFEVAIAPADRKLFTSGFQRAKLFVGGAQQLVGMHDGKRSSGAADKLGCSIPGRSMASFLVDCDAPPQDISDVTLRQLAERLVAPYTSYIKGIVTNATAGRYRMAGKGRSGYQSPDYVGLDTQKATQWRIQHGESIWAVLVKFAKQVGAHVWLSPTGELTISEPDYNVPTEWYGRGLWATKDGTGNILNSELNLSAADRYATYSATGMGSRPGPVEQDPNGNPIQLMVPVRLEVEVIDPGPALHRRTGNLLQARVPRTKHLHQTWNGDLAMMRRVVRAEMERRALEGFEYTVPVKSVASETGALWTPDTMVRVHDELHDPPIIGSFYILGRDAAVTDSAETCSLRLIPPRVWLYHQEVGEQQYSDAMAKEVWW